MKAASAVIQRIQRDAGIAWSRRTESERLLVAAAAALVLGTLLWSVALGPALRTLQSADSTRVTLENQLQTMLAMQAQARALGSQPHLSGTVAGKLLEKSVQTTFGKNGRVTLANNQATVVLEAVSPLALARWLGQARVDAQSKPITVQIVRSSDAASGEALWSGTLQMSLPAP